ncbi:hypothetical protein JYT29_03045 [Nitrospina gracilis]|nr:hypothetical protein [Nitrospina gracilis]
MPIVKRQAINLSLQRYSVEDLNTAGNQRFSGAIVPGAGRKVFSICLDPDG